MKYVHLFVSEDKDSDTDIATVYFSLPALLQAENLNITDFYFDYIRKRYKLNSGQVYPYIELLAEGDNISSPDVLGFLQYTKV